MTDRLVTPQVPETFGSAARLGRRRAILLAETDLLLNCTVVTPGCGTRRAGRCRLKR